MESYALQKPSYELLNTKGFYSIFNTKVKNLLSLLVINRDDGVIPPYVVGGSTFGQKWG